MGILACDRPGCDNMMCDYMVLRRYYLCWECLKELKVFKHSLTHVTDHAQAISSLNFFMQTMKGYYEDAMTNPIVDKVFKQEVRPLGGDDD